MRIDILDTHLHNLPVLFNGILEFDTFSLHVPSDKRQLIRTYNAFFKCKSTLKEVTLHSPVTIVGTEMIDNVEQNHVSVKKLTIVSRHYATADVLLERCSSAFPNLRFMTLVGCCGTWQANSKFHIELEKYTLEKLEIDLAPLYKDIRGQKCILVQVQIESLGDTYFYKVPFNRSEVTRVDDQDLNGLKRQKDYVLLHVAVGSLKYLAMAHTHHSKTLGIKINTKLDIDLVSTK